MVSWTVFDSHINTWIVSTPDSNTNSAVILWWKMEESSILWRELYLSTNFTNGWTKCPALRRRNIYKNSSKSTSWLRFKNRFQFKRLNQFFWSELNKPEALNFELELMKINDCCLVGCGHYGSNLVSIEKKLAFNLFCWNSNRSQLLKNRLVRAVFSWFLRLVRVFVTYSGRKTKVSDVPSFSRQ